MYLKECLIENVGPIKLLDFSLPFDEHGNPKPVVLVGQNGSGKSIFLSHVVDALMEFAKQAYQDVVPDQGFRSSYFKLTGPTNQRTGEQFGVALLGFAEAEGKYTYADKSGILDANAYRERTGDRFGHDVTTWPLEGNHKAVSQAPEFFEKYFRDSAVCYFPPTRHEDPHWLNQGSVVDHSSFSFVQRLSGQLGKPLIVERSAEENKRWLLDVILDSRVEIETTLSKDPPPALQHVITSNVGDNLYLKQSKQNVEKLLQHVLQEEEVRLTALYRTSAYRLPVLKEGRVHVPSLDHLSSGQASLFNTFATVIRYADRSDINKSYQLHDIEGIVLIDEVDANAHSALQHEVLPKLIKLFPKVQFILTSHSPLFLLGMEKEYGSEGFEILEMPSGQPITTERFSEFERSWEYYRETRAYEEDLEQSLSVSGEPLVYTEGKTDARYIRTALKVLGHQNMLERLDIKPIGSEGPAGRVNSGKTGLDQTRKVIEANPDLTKRRVLLLYDHDAGKRDEDLGPLSIRSIPEQKGSRAKKGIENLLPSHLFEERFYSTRSEDGDYGEQRTHQTFDKRSFCKWICEDRRVPEDFAGFAVVARLLEAFLEASDSQSNEDAPTLEAL